LGDENAPGPTRTKRRSERTQEAEGALRVGAVRRSPEESDTATVKDTGTVKKPPLHSKVDAVVRFATGPASDPKAVSAPEPVWAPVPEPPRPIPNWDGTSVSMSWPDARWEHASKTTLPRARVHPAFRARHRRRRRSRAIVTTVALASLFVVFAAVAIIMSSLHHSAPAPAGPRVTSTSAASSSSVSRMRAATDAAAAATTTTRSRLDAIPGIPTPAQVAAVINPYVTSLQRYETTLSGTAVPIRARTVAARARTLIRQDARFLSTINGLAPLRLGSYLDEFDQNATLLLADLGSLEQDLRTANS